MEAQFRVIMEFDGIFVYKVICDYFTAINDASQIALGLFTSRPRVYTSIKRKIAKGLHLIVADIISFAKARRLFQYFRKPYRCK